MTAPRLALVLAGGGVAGIAWETGFLLGVQDQFPAAADALLNADLLLGTSAGATVSAQLSSGTTLADLFARQVAPTHGELTPAVGIEEFMALFDEAMHQPDRTSALQLIGKWAAGRSTVPEEERRAVIARRLPSHEWPQRTLVVTAIDVETGELAAFDRHSGVGLVDAVVASCAVPGVWPAVSIGGRRYMDGGVRSRANLDLAADAETVVMLAPTAEPGLSPLGPTLVEEAAEHPGRVLSVFADETSLRAFGPNALDPACRRPSANAGREQGRGQAAEIAEFLEARAS